MKERPRHIRGFTLIEILIVLLIIGVVIGTAFIVPRNSGPQQQIQTEALRLQMLLDHARERALLENRELGLALTGTDGYQWLSWSEDEQRWLPLAEITFRRYQLPEGIVINNLDEKDAKARSRPSFRSITDGDDSEAAPTWILFTDMQMTPLRLELSLQADSRHSARVEGDGIGPVQIP